MGTAVASWPSSIMSIKLPRPKHRRLGLANPETGLVREVILNPERAVVESKKRPNENSWRYNHQKITNFSLNML